MDFRRVLSASSPTQPVTGGPARSPRAAWICTLPDLTDDAASLVPQCGGGRIDATAKETLWAKYFTGAPRPLRPSEQQYSDAGFDPVAE